MAQTTDRNFDFILLRKRKGLLGCVPGTGKRGGLTEDASCPGSWQGDRNQEQHKARNDEPSMISVSRRYAQRHFVDDAIAICILFGLFFLLSSPL